MTLADDARTVHTALVNAFAFFAPSPRMLGALALVKTLPQKIEALETTIIVLESARPHWAQGFTSDSMAAQGFSSALTALWKLLEADNQTDAVGKLTALIAERDHLNKYCEVLEGGVRRLDSDLLATESTLSDCLDEIEALMRGRDMKEIPDVE